MLSESCGGLLDPVVIVDPLLCEFLGLLPVCWSCCLQCLPPLL
jgi:hypothetical protein